MTLAGVYISISIAANIAGSQRTQLLNATEAAANQAQNIFDSAVAQGGADELDAASGTALGAISRTTYTPSGTSIALLREPGQGGQPLLLEVTSPNLAVDQVISSQLRRAVRDADRRQLFSQPVALHPHADSTVPGLAVGTVLDVPLAGRYELYLVYDLSDADRTLGFVQQSLAFGGLALVVLIGAVTYVVVRLVVGPVRIAAEASEKLAEGHLEERIPVRGEDVLARLARSFNGMADSLQRQITRLASLSQVQQRFVSDVSHELRTPLTTIRLAGDMLYDKRGDFDPETARAAELLHTQIERFEVLLGDLLEMSRFDAGAVHLEIEATDVAALAREALENVAPLAGEKGSELRLVAPSVPVVAEVDARRIRRVLQNLLANAIDHGEGFPVVLYLAADETTLSLAVRDYGIGMTASAARRVFDRFWRADPSRQRTTGGTGLGLAISLEDAMLHGGRLEVWSRPRLGSCFRLTVPRHAGGPLGAPVVPLPPDAEWSPYGELPVLDPPPVAPQLERARDEGRAPLRQAEPVVQAEPAVQAEPGAAPGSEPEPPSSQGGHAAVSPERERRSAGA